MSTIPSGPLNDFAYKVRTYYDASAERSIAWDDQEIGLRWPTSNPFVSERDGRNPRPTDAVRIQGGRDGS